MSGPNILLRLEGLATLTASVLLFPRLGGRWGIFALLFLAPDLAMLGYLANPRLGSILYDAVHSYVSVALLVAIALLTGHPSWLPFLSILAAHIGFDRALGYGLKYATSFQDTHLQRV